MWRKTLISGGAAVAAALAGACTADLAELRETKPTGSAFTQSLTGEYLSFAAFEADEMQDWRDSGRFARKGLRTAGGETVPPEDPDKWQVNDAKRQELSRSRDRLLTALAAGAGEQAPGPAARAQAAFDCWLEQEEEGYQPAHIEACRKRFLASLGDAEATLPKAYILYFPFDSARITAKAARVLDAAAEAARARDNVRLTLIGHADRAGPDGYNLTLSMKRAEAVRKALLDQAVPEGRIAVTGAGEARPVVATRDGAREARNRRVEIILP